MQGQRQNLVQQQRLSLSPRMVQSIRLMAMPFAEMRERIMEEVETNPALEIIRDPVMQPPRNFEQFAPATTYVQAGSDDESDEHRNFIEGVLHHNATLQEHLLSQLADQKAKAGVLALAALLIQNLDRNGFHLAPPEELPGADNAADLEEALAMIRSFEPRGCAVRDFAESLSVQARLLGRGPDGWKDDPILYATVRILEERIDLLAKGKPDALLRALSKQPLEGLALDLEDAEAVFEVIRSLDPYPGRMFDSAPDSYIVPDVYVTREEDDFSVIINEEEIPVLGISPFFMDLEGGDPSSASADGTEKEARDFARESVREAQWFIHTLSRRNLTILKLARALVVFQRDFFRYGPTRLTPLRMKDIAEEIGLHEATVSRAANGKYLQCEWGVFELRYFFSNSVGSSAPSPYAHRVRPASGDSPASVSPAASGLHSKQGVKEILREIIASSTENLSDQKLADQLALRGIKIARRTVAKYRGELNIQSSFDR